MNPMPSSSMDFDGQTILEMNVLLVDNDVEFLVEMIGILQLCSFKVNAVADVSAAYSMLSKGSTEFDLLMVDLNSTTFKFVHDAIGMGFTVILMSTNANATLVKNAIQDGAFLLMEKPIRPEELKYLCQHLLREKTRKSKISMGMTEGVTMDRNAVKKRVVSEETKVEYIQFDSITNATTHNTTTPKTCIEWTPELHKKFMDAVRQLGDGRCFPKEILEIMNVPGLTRMQVASHLQKCRYGSKHSLHQRQANSGDASNSSNSKPRRFKTIKYGSAPQIKRDAQPHEYPLQDNNRQDEQVLPRANNNVEYPQVIGQQGINDFNVPIPIDNNMNEMIHNEDVLGNTMGLPQPAIQMEADLGVADYNLVPNDFEFQQFDYGYGGYTGQSCDHVGDAGDSDFWSSSTVNFPRD